MDNLILIYFFVSLKSFFDLAEQLMHEKKSFIGDIFWYAIPRPPDPAKILKKNKRKNFYTF